MHFIHFVFSQNNISYVIHPSWNPSIKKLLENNQRYLRASYTYIFYLFSSSLFESSVKKSASTFISFIYLTLRPPQLVIFRNQYQKTGVLNKISMSYYIVLNLLLYIVDRSIYARTRNNLLLQIFLLSHNFDIRCCTL